jgi:chemotaxis protein MotB
MDASQTIVVKKIKKSGHGHHGGAWKVAFADFVTAMMAFFLLLWLLGSTTPEERAAISDYFENPSAVQGPGGASTSMIKLGAVDKEQRQQNADSESESDSQANARQEVEVESRDAKRERETLQGLKTDLEQAIEASTALKQFKDQLLLDITPEGLRVQIIDKENRPMFDSGSSHLKSYSQTILQEIAAIINKVPNKISLTGHTDATPYSSIRGYTNWELSTDRANASRRALVRGGLDPQKIAKVVGLSSTVLFDKANPRSPVNRRISMIVMNKQAEDALLNNGRTQVKSARDAATLLAPGQRRSGIQRLAPKSLPKPGVGKPRSLPPVKKLSSDSTHDTQKPSKGGAKSVVTPIKPITLPVQSSR